MDDKKDTLSRYWVLVFLILLFGVNLYGFEHYRGEINDDIGATEVATDAVLTNYVDSNPYQAIISYYRDIELSEAGDSRSEFLKLVEQAMNDGAVSNTEFSEIKNQYLSIKTSKSKSLVLESIGKSKHIVANDCPKNPHFSCPE